MTAKAHASRSHFAKLFYAQGKAVEAALNGTPLPEEAGSLAYSVSELRDDKMKAIAELALARDELRRAKEDLAFAQAAKLTPRQPINTILAEERECLCVQPHATIAIYCDSTRIVRL